MQDVKLCLVRLEKLMDVLLKVRGIHAEVLRNMSVNNSQIYSSHLA